MSEPTAPLPPADGPPPVSPYGPKPPGSGSGGTVAAAILSVVFVAASLLVAIVVNSSDSGSTASAAPRLGSSGPAVIASSSGSGGVAQPQPVPSSSSSSSTYSPPPVTTPTPTHIPLSGSAINRTFEVYMNALLYHNLSALKSATCPRLRHTETGTALHGKYIHRWKGYSYNIYNTLDYVRLSAKVYFDVGGTAVYDWYVERTSGGDYYVCGFLS